MKHLSGNEWLREGGFLPRCLFGEFKCEPQFDDGIEKCVPLALIQHYAKKFRGLYEAYRKAIGDGAEPQIITVNPDAARMMRNFHNEVTDYRRRNDEIDGFSARWVENAKRIAGVLHAEYYGAKAHEKPLQIEMVEYAIKVVRYFIGKQKELLAPIIEEAKDRDIEKFANLIKERSGCATMRELVRSKLSEEQIEEIIEMYNGRYVISEHENSNKTVTKYVHHENIGEPHLYYGLYANSRDKHLRFCPKGTVIDHERIPGNVFPIGPEHVNRN
jgi:Protein of unknown function (DUF3987)